MTYSKYKFSHIKARIWDKFADEVRILLLKNRHDVIVDLLYKTLEKIEDAEKEMRRSGVHYRTAEAKPKVIRRSRNCAE